jgi:hypothetical protein
MHFSFESDIGASPLTFGADRTVVRAGLSPLVPKTQATEPENDFYTKEGLIVGFDKNNKLEFIEVFPPSTAQFGEVRFFDKPFPQILADLRSMGLSYREIHGAYRFDSVGISLYAPNKTIQSASLFKPGYYQGTC